MICNFSNKIKLKPIEADNLHVIQEWRNNKNFQPFLREYRELSSLNINNWFKEITFNDKFEFFIIYDNLDKPLGVSGLTYINWVSRNADIHLAIYEKDWIDDVYAPEVLNTMLDYGFNYLNLHKIYAEVYEIDFKKKTFFLKSGFKKDGCLRDHYYYKGKYVNSHIFSILKKEFYI